MPKVFTLEEALQFLRSSVRPGMVATVRADGRPHVAPVWFDVDDGQIVFETGADTVKGRNLVRTGRAAISVQDDKPPYTFVTIDGPVAISEDLAELKTWAARLGGRYLGEDRAEEMGERNGVPGELLVHLTPEHVVGIDDLTG